MGNIKQVAVLGATGSIGRQTLEVISALSRSFRVIALAAGKNRKALQEQARRFRPRFICLEDEASPLPGYERLSLEEIARHPEVDVVVIATSGHWGLLPTLAAVRAGKRVALANKESLVMAGDIITAEAKRSGARLIPVDSEHSAIWQCLRGERRRQVRRIILTASGGPFYGRTPAALAAVTVAEALRHPSWRMGRKVTIDSATLMNKGLEVIEAHWLFNMPYDAISVLVHPQSIVHSMVEFADGSLKAQLSSPDMRLPIQYALAYPSRRANPGLPRLDWNRLKALDFAPPDTGAFPCLRLATEAGRRGGSYPAVLCGADEAAVELFLSGRIGFTDIARLVERVLEEHPGVPRPALEEILASEAWARQRTAEIAGGENR